MAVRASMSKYTLNGLKGVNEAATGAVSIGNAKPCTLLHMSVEPSPKQLGLPNRDRPDGSFQSFIVLLSRNLNGLFLKVLSTFDFCALH